MAQPAAYALGYSFQNYQSSNPTRPLPADKLEDEFYRIGLTTDQIRNNLALIQRDDTEIANQTIGYDQLKPELRIAIQQLLYSGTSLENVGTTLDSVYESKALLAIASVASHTNAVMTLGGPNIGDGGGAIWKRLSSAPVSPTSRHVEAQPGVWFENTGPEWNVLDFGADKTGVADSWDAFQVACSLGGVVNIPPGTYKISKQVDVMPGTLLQGLGTWDNVILNGDSSAIGELGQNCLQFRSNTWARNFKLNNTVTAFQTVPNGDFQGGLAINYSRLGVGVTATLIENVGFENIWVECVGPENGHGVHIYGHTKYVIQRNVKCTGTSGILNVAHWAGDFDQAYPGTPATHSGDATKSWHPCHLLYDRCLSESTQVNANGYRIAGAAFVTYKDCVTNADDGLEIYAGDSGGKLAQPESIDPRDCLAGIVIDGYRYTPGYLQNYAITVSGNGNDGLHWADIWYGNDTDAQGRPNRSSVIIRNSESFVTDLYANTIDPPAANNTADGFATPIVVSFINRCVIENTGCGSDRSDTTEYGMQAYGVNELVIKGCKITSKFGLRLRATKEASVQDTVIDYEPGNYDTTTYGIEASSYSHTAVLAQAVSIGDTRMYFRELSDTITPGAQIFYDSSIIEATGVAAAEDNVSDWGLSTTGDVASTGTRDITNIANPRILPVSTRITISGGVGAREISSRPAATTARCYTAPGVVLVGATITISEYQVDQDVFVNDVRYRCKVAHVPDASTQPGIGVNWATVWEVVTNNCNVSIEPSKVAIAAGQTVTIKNWVRKLTVERGRISGHRIAIALNGSVELPYVKVSGATISRWGLYGIDCDNVQQGVFEDNIFENCGLATNSTDTRCINIQADCNNIAVVRNRFTDHNPAKWGVYMNAGAKRCAVSDNVFLAKHPTTSGAACIQWPSQVVTARQNAIGGNIFAEGIDDPILPTNTVRGTFVGEQFVGQSTAIPATGIWNRGDIVRVRTAGAAGSQGSQNVTAGEFGSLVGVTATTLAGDPLVPVNDATNIVPQHVLTIAGTGNGPFFVRSKNGNTLTVTPAPDTPLVGAAVAYVAPSFKSMGNLAA